MYTITSVLVIAIGLFAQYSAAVPPTLKRYPSDDQSTSLSARSSLVQSQLGPRLSRHAALYFPNNPQFTNLTDRWSLSAQSEFAVVVVPGVDNDVAVTVYPTFQIRNAEANARHPGSLCEQIQHSFPRCQQGSRFRTRSFLSNVYHGISIRIDALNSISINEGGNTATLGGGTYQDQVVKYLDSHGKASRNALNFPCLTNSDANKFQLLVPAPASA